MLETIYIFVSHEKYLQEKSNKDTAINFIAFDVQNTEAKVLEKSGDYSELFFLMQHFE